MTRALQLGRPTSTTRPLPLAIAVALAFALLAPALAQTPIGVQFEKVARTGDMVPGRESIPNVVFNGRAFQNSGNTPGVLSRPTINNNGVVVFRGVSSDRNNFNLNPAIGLYVKEPNLPLARLVDDTLTSGSPTFAVPGKPATTRFTNFDPPLLNDAGDVVFRATYGGPGVSGSGFYATTILGGPIVKLVDQDDAVPGVTPATTFNRGFFFSFTQPPLAVSLNDNGQVVFHGRFQITGQQFEDSGLYGTTVAGGAIVRLADTTESVGALDPNGVVIAGATFTSLSQGEQPAINNNGVVIFEAIIRFTSGLTRFGIFTVPVDGSSLPTRRAQEAQQVTTSDSVNRSLFSLFGGHDINDNNQFIFQNSFASGAGALNALVKGDLTTAALTVVVDGAGGYPIPGRATGVDFTNIFIANLNDSGQFGFAGWDESPNGRGAYASNLSGSLVTMSQNGQVPPGLSAPASFSSGEPRSADINDEGNMALTPPAFDGVSDSVFGLYFYEECSQSLHRVVDRYTSAPAPPVGLGGTFAAPGCSGSPCERGTFINDGFNVRNGHYRTMNDSDEIAFLTAFSTFDVGVYIARVTSGGPVTVSCPPDQTLQCPADTSPATTGVATASGCGAISVTYSDVVTAGCGGTTVVSRTWTASNGDPNTASSCTQTITLTDNTPPLLTCPADLTVECDPATNATAFLNWLAAATATDACGAVTVNNNAPAMPDGCGSVTVEFTATDSCNNTATCSATFTIADSTPPTLFCPAAETVVECDGAGSVDDINAFLASVTGDDSCGGVVIANDFAGLTPDPNCPNASTATVTFTGTDVCGNQATCTATISILDTTPPTITLPEPTTVECDGTGNPADVAAWLAQATAADVCGGATITNDAPATFPIGATTVTFTATDACGLQFTSAAVFTIADATPPTIECPDDLTLECGDAGNDAAIAAWLGGVTASDACGAAPVFNDYAGVVSTCGGAGSVLVTWTATDGANLSASCSATLTIEDTAAPSIAAPAAVTVGIDAGACTASNVDLGAPATSDACGAVSVTNDAPSTFAIGTTVVTWTATDACGRTSTAQQNVTVENLAPTAIAAVEQLTDIGDDAVVRLDGAGSSDAEDENSGLQFVWIVDGVTECSGFGASCEDIALPLSYGEHTVTLQVTDRCGASDEVTVLLDVNPAELSVLEIDRALVNFCGPRPRLRFNGQVGLPLGVDFTELDPTATVAISLAGLEVLAPTVLNYGVLGADGQHWRYTASIPNGSFGVFRSHFHWRGNSYEFRDAGFAVSMHSDMISTTETLLELRLRKKSLLTGPFTLDVGGQALVAFDGDFNVVASDVPYVVEAPGKRVELSLPFPLIATTDFVFAGALDRTVNAGAGLRAAIGRYSVHAYFDDAPFPLGVATSPRSLDFDLAIGGPQYPRSASLDQSDLFAIDCCRWQTNECPDEDD